MKTPSINKSNRRQGSTLLLVLVTTGILGFLLVAYLSLVRSQNIANMRSQCWNQAIPVIEAGVEDALTHLNAHGLTNLYCDNWKQLGDIYYIKRAVGDNYYLVTISNWVAGNTNFRPVIQSRGFVAKPAIMAACAGPMLADAAIPAANGYLGRGVAVQTKTDWLFAKGMVAKGQIDLKGNNITADSFDSTDAMYSNGGRWDPTKPRKDRGDVATNSGLTNSLNVGNADIWGHVSTGPKGSVSIGQGSVGDLAWHNQARRGIKPGWCTDDMNVNFPDVLVPFTGGYLTPSVGTNIDGTRYDYLLDSGNYMLGSLTMSGSETLYVKSNAIAILYVTGDISMSGLSSIQIARGGTLKLYVGGANADLGGNGVINWEKTGYATNFIYFGLPSNKSLNLGGNGTFIGCIYAPSAAFKLNGGGSGAIDFVGASVTDTVTMNGHFKFHYDEALSKIGPFRRYIVTRWDEMTPQDVAGGYIDTTPQGVVH